MSEDTSSGGGRPPRRKRGSRGRRSPSKDSASRPSDSSGERFDPDGEGSLTASEPQRSERGRRDRRRRGRGRDGGGDVEELGATAGIDVIDRPVSETKSRQSLQPGLTLKDLMPFLRPPRTVLILGTSSGAGHNRMATVLAEAFKGIDRNLVVRHHDVLELLDDGQEADQVRNLVEAAGASDALYGTPFDSSGEEPGAAALQQLDEAMGSLFGKKMTQVVVDKRPDHVVCTHWLPLAFLAGLKAEERFTAGVTAMISDPDICERWMVDVVDQYLVSEDDLKPRLQAAGVDPTAVTVAGTPVAPGFSEDVDRRAVMREAGLKSGPLTVLVRPEGLGGADALVATLGHVLEATESVNVVVLAGDDDGLEAAISAMEAPDGSAIKAFGAVRNTHELMGVADVMVARAQPHLMAEACASGLPVLIVRPDPGTQDRMADRMVRMGCGRKIYGARDLETALVELSGNRRQLKEFQDSAEKRRRPDVAHQAVERIAKFVR